MILHISTPEVKELALKAFPEYRGKKFRVEGLELKAPRSLTSYWSEGCRDYWALVNLSNGRVFHVPENGTPFANSGKSFQIGNLPIGIALVNRSYSGNFESITISVHPNNLNRMALPSVPELSENEKMVLKYTRSLKSSYAGISNYRFHEANRETGISLSVWEQTKATLISKGLLNKAGAITESGRNAVQ